MSMHCETMSKPRPFEGALRFLKNSVGEIGGSLNNISDTVVSYGLRNPLRIEPGEPTLYRTIGNSTYGLIVKTAGRLKERVWDEDIQEVAYAVATNIPSLIFIDIPQGIAALVGGVFTDVEDSSRTHYSEH